MGLFVARPISIIEEGGTKLYFRRNPPADGTSYQANEPGIHLGYVVGSVSVPRWMSSEFATALEEQQDKTKPEADLNLYAADWFERVTYIPVDSSDAMKKIGDQMIAANETTQHALSTGCSQVNARTKVSRLDGDATGITGVTLNPVDSGDATDSNVFYGIVSLQETSEPGKMTEFTIAPLSTRKSFVATKLHQQRLADCTFLRTPILLDSTIARGREAALNAIKTSNLTP